MSFSVWRVSAIVAGVAVMATVVHNNIAAGLGYREPAAWLQIAVAIGVAVAAYTAAHVWSSRRWLAVALVATVAIGEAFNLLSTGERMIASREQAQAPLRAGEEARAAAGKRVADAVAAVARAKMATSKRLTEAIAAKAAADKAVTDKSTERTCLVNCRDLLQKAVTDAATEVAAAREELAKGLRAAESELQAAQSALATMAPPPSSTPLADRLGLPAWVLDLAHSALGATAANLLAFLLIAAGGHQSPRKPPKRQRSPRPRQEAARPSAPPPEPPLEPENRTRPPRVRTQRDRPRRLGRSPLAGVRPPGERLH